MIITPRYIKERTRKNFTSDISGIMNCIFPGINDPKPRKKKKSSFKKYGGFKRQPGEPGHYKLHQRHLKVFWNAFGGKRVSGVGISRAFKISILKKYSDIKLFRRNKQSLKRKREKFDEIKDEKFKSKNKICFICGHKPNVRHHIIQIQYGGINTKQNIIYLCYGCHAEIHDWLKKE